MGGLFANKVLRKAAALLVIVLAGCDADGGPAVPFDIVVVDTVDTWTHGDLRGDDAAAHSGLGGTWARLEVRISESSAPIVGTIRSETVILSIVRMQHDGLSVRMDGEICDFALDTGSDLVRIVIPDAFVAALVFPVRTAVALSVDGGDALQLAEPRTTELRGMALADPEHDPLPENPGDPAVRDEDADGLPGVTVRATGVADGEMYVVQRVWAESLGVAADDRITGDVTWAQEQVILGTDNDLLALFDGDAVFLGGTYEMLRVGSDADCDWLVDRRETLFPPESAR